MLVLFLFLYFVLCNAQTVLLISLTVIHMQDVTERPQQFVNEFYTALRNATFYFYIIIECMVLYNSFVNYD